MACFASSCDDMTGILWAYRLNFIELLLSNAEYTTRSLFMRIMSFSKQIYIILIIFSGQISSVRAATDEAEILWSPPGKLINVGTHRLHIFCLGERNHKPVAIIDSGLGSFSLEWLKLQQDLSDEYQICSYDRAGYGWSDPGPFPRTTSNIVSELKTLLQNAHIPPPYLLLGHSFGGYNMMYFTKAYPKDVAGLILIDSSHPDQAAWFPSVFPEMAYSRGRARYVSFPKLPENYPHEKKRLGYHLMSSRKATNALRFESMNFEISARQVAQMGSLPGIPLIVLSRGERAWPDTPEGEKLETIWTRLQNDLARMSEKSKHISADFSGHYIHLDQPLLVEDAIRSIENGGPCVKREIPLNNVSMNEVSSAISGEC